MTYDEVALGVLAYEFGFSDRSESDRKIKRRLRYRKLGPYDPERVALLRRFKDSVQAEIGRGEASAYYAGRHDERYSHSDDFDQTRLIGDFAAQFPEISEATVRWFVGFAVFLYYLR